MKFLFVTAILSMMKNYKNLFTILLTLELMVLGLFFFVTSFTPNKFVLVVFIFVISSVTGLVLFLYVVKFYSSVLSSSWVF